jgi:hypothetical protein
MASKLLRPHAEDIRHVLVAAVSRLSTFPLWKCDLSHKTGADWFALTQR